MVGALHVAASPVARQQRWAPDVDLNYTCSNDDTDAMLGNFSSCPIRDYRTMLKAACVRIFIAPRLPDMVIINTHA